MNDSLVSSVTIINLYLYVALLLKPITVHRSGFQRYALFLNNTIVMNNLAFILVYNSPVKSSTAMGVFWEQASSEVELSKL